MNETTTNTDDPVLLPLYTLDVDAIYRNPSIQTVPDQAEPEQTEKEEPPCDE